MSQANFENYHRLYFLIIVPFLESTYFEILNGIKMDKQIQQNYKLYIENYQLDIS